jgi:hypothetical protein
MNGAYIVKPDPCIDYFWIRGSRRTCQLPPSSFFSFTCNRHFQNKGSPSHAAEYLQYFYAHV